MATVWTKQHHSVWDTLNQTGRYIARREFIVSDLEEHADLVLEVYDWYVRKAAARHPKPPDAQYPIWVSLAQAATMMKSEGTVILQCEVDDTLIMPVNIGKWGAMLNYSYIPANVEDEQRHQRLLADYGVTDAKAYMSRFYPDVKREIVASWDRLFDDSVIVNNRMEYGTVWELRREWVSQVL